MSSRANYTPEEWTTLVQAPIRVGTAVIISGKTGPIQVIKEASTLTKVVTETNSSNELVQAVVADWKEGKEKPLRDENDHSDDAQRRAQIMEECRQTASLLATKTAPEEAEEYKQWLLTVGQRVAEAAKEGGFLGFGDKLVSADEAETLHELALALGAKQ